MATILLADDSASHRSLMELVLGSEGYDIVSVADGHEALAYLKDYTPELIILDVNMPRLDGLGVCERVKHVSRLKHVPVMILTALRDAHIERRVQAARADVLVGKPLMGKDFRKLVSGLLARGSVEGLHKPSHVSHACAL